MSKKIALVLILFLLIFFTYGKFSANAEETLQVSDMLCRLSSKQTTKCSGTPVLEKGTLRIFSTNLFQLNGHYNACFHMEDVIIKGRYQSIQVNDLIQLELLGEQIQENRDRTEDFPKTIGLIKLNKQTLKGVFIDIWSTIRTQDVNREYGLSLRLVCQLL